MDRDPITVELAAIERRKRTLLTYLRDRIELEDWHGVADCAMDLRDDAAKREVLLRLRATEAPPDPDMVTP